MSETNPDTDAIVVKFDQVAPRGDAIGEVEGEKPIYANGVIPGETVRVRIRKRRRNWTAVDVLELVEPSPHRIQPRCPLFENCDGCQFQYISYPFQLELKKRMVTQALQSEGGFETPPVADPIGAKDPWHYRNHGRFTVQDGRPGFVRRFRRAWFEVAHCDIMEKRINAVLERVNGRLGDATQFNIRVGDKGAMMVQPKLNLEGVELESGQTSLRERLHDRAFEVSPASFFQVNRAQAEVLIDVVREHAVTRPDAVLVDAYAGVGTFAILLADAAGQVIAIEESGPAVRNAQQNAHGIENIEFRLGKTEEVLPALQGRVDALILDPPRSGCAAPVMEAVGRLKPQRIVYVSCDPSSLGRDLAKLCELDYNLSQVIPVDMFPQTHHIECVAVLDLTDR